MTPSDFEARGLRVKPPHYVSNSYGDATSWMADTPEGTFVYGVDFSGCFYSQTPSGETNYANLADAMAAANADHAARVCAAIEARGLRVTYPEWFRSQTPERQTADLEHLYNSQKCGEAQRSGDWKEAERLSILMRGYHVDRACAAIDVTDRQNQAALDHGVNPDAIIKSGGDGM